MINSNHENYVISSENTSLKEPQSNEKTISMVSPIEWFLKINRTCFNNKISSLISFLGIGIGLLTRDSPILKILGGAAIISALALAFTSREKQLRMNVANLIETCPDYDTMQKNDKLIENQLKNLINSVMSNLPESVKNETNINILKNQCKIILNGLLPSSKNDQEADSIQKEISNKIFNILNNFHANMYEISNRIEKDKKMIGKTFFSGKNLDYPKIEMASSESHNKGQRPCFITFNGKDKIVYKPRDIRVDAYITGEQSGSLFRLINSMSDKIKLTTYKFLYMDNESYGYTEFLSHDPSDYELNLKEMEEYYYMLGAMQAIATIFGIHDLHRENILVHGKKPFLIDLEVSFNVNELIYHNGETSIIDAIINCKKIDNDNENTPNHVILLTEDKTKEPHSTHFKKNYKKYYQKKISSGFNHIKHILKYRLNKSKINKFIDNLPNDLNTRFIPMSSFDLVSWSITTLSTDAENLAKLLNEKPEELKKLTEYDKKNTIQKEHTIKDVENSDVSYMKSNINGNVYYNNALFLKSKENIKNLIKKSVGKTHFLDNKKFIQLIDKSFNN
jgi:hypothetical protein